ncbi:uncharacterized protein E5676_scaffold98G00630 [Cucumis melo var. makuwa]|uniref:CACTA en-spm transposon protein n=1 Tax=Cucumis melo var. makuwa TaxID=1194695 RepID=A0A5A7TAT1_CUCMM|nr:uncharacterized protein E6C27_scaffold262G001340 [Cucumis melo var. makuwa]TYK05607.1 uncharacterized protein E5676_scaffold98G00630 [Cucumis melo var. makuwa]
MLKMLWVCIKDINGDSLNGFEHKYIVIELREFENLSHDFFSLAIGPSLNVHCYNGCIMGGLRFHMSERDSRHTTENSGLMVIGESDASGSGNNNFYNVLNKNKRIWDVPEVDGVNNEHLNVLEIVVNHRLDEHIKDDTLCRTDLDLTIVERSVVCHVTDDFIDDVDEHLSHASETSDDDE